LADRTVRWWWVSQPPPALAAFVEGLAAGHTPDAPALKAAAGRSVWALPGVSGGILLKHFRVRGAETLKYLVRPSRARSEFRAMVAFGRLGLPAVSALGFGERREAGRLREAWFLGRLVPSARTLGDEVQAAAARGDRRRVLSLAASALSVTTRLHAHPWLHRDLHADNLLLTPDEQVLVTDLHSVWRVPRLTRRMRLANLARLLFSLRGGIDLDADVPALLLPYAASRGDRPDALVEDVRRALHGFESDYVRGRTTRCLGNSSQFAAERMHGGRVFRRRGFSVEQLATDLERHDVALRQGRGVLGRAPRSLVTRVAAAPGDAGAHVVKEFPAAGAWSRVRQRLGLSRARSAWVGARRLEVLDIPTPQALALLERADGSAVLVTRALETATSLREEAARLAAPQAVLSGAAARERAALARAAGFLVGRLARAGLRHADLAAKNVLVTPGPAPPARDRRVDPPRRGPALWLIDLDGLRRMAPHDARGTARMLGQLGDLPAGITRADRVRFRHAFAAAAGRDIPRAVLESAARQTLLRAQRRERRARPGPEPRASI